MTYNSLSVLPECLRSLEMTAPPGDMEVIVVDNASNDGTIDYLEKYQRHGQHPFVSLQVLELDDNRGYAYANNRGIERCEGSVFLLLNPDTIVGPQAIDTCMRRLHSAAKIGAVGCRLELPSGMLDKACKRSFPTVWNSLLKFSGLSRIFPKSRFLANYNLSYLDEFGSYPVDCLCGAFLMVTRSVVDTVGMLDEDFFMYGEDIDWCYRIKKSGYDVWYEGGVTTVHCKGGNGGKKSRESLRHFYDTMHLYFIKTLGHHPHSLPAWLLRCVVNIMLRVHLLGRAITK